MFGTLARNVVYRQGRYTAEEINDMRDAALKSEKLADPWYNYLRETKAFREELAELRKENPYLTWSKTLSKFGPYLAKKHPRCYAKAIDDALLDCER